MVNVLMIRIGACINPNFTPFQFRVNGMAHVYIETLIQRCKTLGHIKQIQAHLLTTGHFQFCSLRSRLLDLCAVSPAGDLGFAVAIFRQIHEPLTNDWNAIIRGLAAGPEPSRAVAWFLSMLRASSSSRCRVDALTCTFTLKACARALCSSTTVQLHAQTSRRGLIADALLYTTLLDAYSKNGDLSSAQKLFEEMPVRDIASWNALIAGLASGNRAYEALELYRRMESDGINPNEVTVLGALAACSHLGDIKEGEKIHGYVKGANLDQNVIVCNAIIDMYAKCGFIDKAFEVFDQIPAKKSVVTWNTMIMGFAIHGEAYKALEIFEQMHHNNIKPDDVSYLAALCACNHMGLTDHGLAIFNSISSNGVEPNMRHYGSLVDLLGRAGRLREAYNVISSIPMVPDPILWQSLLNASQIHKNVEMAETASKKLLEMGSDNDGDFVLLSNIYAAHGRWNDVGRVRDTMKARYVQKIPGFSYIEAEGTIHKFYNGDKSHDRWRDIYKKIDEIRFKIREFGYMAETGLVLHDIGDEEKENALCFHSEKLAMAYGLIITEEEDMPIRVIKNLRICGDCHVVFKHVSKIYNREIVVRDRVRFHRFKDGSCSCRDYW
ncbi:PREDICTED: pentatricopeptide repeat-containing protein At1g34160 [Tarenaya hassleriana]|uniref:pentatricopeptide repeat-containing protein At1g34160 n=1 Tax=Tarenaya hassleriana TaxID=28532 RepID=UPI0008FD8CEE|nr:PREDICTED: pentatricopeptide repeat-containing protein At1g34160 [Tarenaya hassleriana]